MFRLYKVFYALALLLWIISLVQSMDRGYVLWSIFDCIGIIIISIILIGGK